MKNYKGTLYGATAYSVIIGVTYMSLAILGLLTRWCVLESKGSSLAYMIYLIYFRVGSCDTGIEWNLLNIDSNLPVQLPDETEAVRRTFIFLITYLGLHAGLIIISLYALCGVNNSCLGRRSYYIFFVPWLIILVGIIVLDVLATVYYVLDTISLTSVDGLLNILEVGNIDATRSTFEQISAHYRYLPAIIMLVTSAKIFILFIANIVWIVAITKAGWTASTYHKYLDKTKRNYENTMASVNPAFEGLRDDAVATKQHERQMEYLSDQSSIHEIQPTSSTQAAESRYKDASQNQGFVYPYQMKKIDKPQSPHSAIEDEDSYKIKRPSTLVIPQRSFKHSQENLSSQTREIDNRLSRYQETSGSAVKTVEPLKSDDVSEQPHSTTRVFVLPPITEANRLSHTKPIPPPKPHTNRYSHQPTVGRESPILYRPERTNSARNNVERSASNLRAPQELRSQLPWSYFNPRDEATPKKSFNHLEENEDVPNVPVPDYTLHYGKKARTNFVDSEGDSGNNYQRY